MEEGKSRKSLWDASAAAVLVPCPELLLNCSWLFSPCILGAFQAWNDWISTCLGLTMWGDVSTLEMNPTGADKKALLSNCGAFPDRCETKLFRPPVLMCLNCITYHDQLQARELIATWISVWIQYLWLKISSWKYRHFWEMLYREMRTGNCQL